MIQNQQRRPTASGYYTNDAAGSATKPTGPSGASNPYRLDQVHLDREPLTADASALGEMPLREIPRISTSGAGGSRAGTQATAVDLDLPRSGESESELGEALNQLARLVANVTDAYTAAIFMADPLTETLQLAAVHTLSRDVVAQARIGYGCGLVGWTAENAVRISVCPFEHDSTTLLYYGQDQALKSFIAVPVLDAQGQLLGVISCDSKKSYAFAKITEKILIDCASQASAIITLHRRIAANGKPSFAVNTERLSIFLDLLRDLTSERALLEQAAALPLEFVDRDALVVITTEEPGAAASSFYSPSNQVRVGHRLLELVCRHKKVICGERSVQAQTADDNKERSFLSIPFHISKREAGSINLLSRAFDSFSSVEVQTLEKVARVIGKELELIRLRSNFVSPESATGLMNWPQFHAVAKGLFPERAGDTKSNRAPYTLIRFALTNVSEIEDFLGVETTQKTVLKFMRLVQQAKGSSAIAGYLYGSEVLVISEKSEADRILGRLKRLLERFSLSEENSFEVGNRQKFDHTNRAPGVKLHELLSRGLKRVQVSSPSDGETLDELLAKSNRLLELAAEQSEKSLEVFAHASNW